MLSPYLQGEGVPELRVGRRGGLRVGRREELMAGRIDGGED